MLIYGLLAMTYLSEFPVVCGFQTSGQLPKSLKSHLLITQLYEDDIMKPHKQTAPDLSTIGDQHGNIEDRHQYNKTAAIIHDKNTKDLISFLIVLIMVFLFLILTCGILEQENGRFCGFRKFCCCGNRSPNSNEYSRLGSLYQSPCIDSESLCEIAQRKTAGREEKSSASGLSDLPSCCLASSEGTGKNVSDYGSIAHVEPAASRNLKSNFAAIETNNMDEVATTTVDIETQPDVKDS